MALVAHDMMHTRTARDLAVMIAYQMTKHGDLVTLNHHGGTVLSEARQNAAKELIEHGCDWIMFVDSDMGFPKNTLERLLSHGEDVVAANCSKRKRPVAPTARRVTDDGDELVWPDPAVRGLEKVDTVGTGIMLIKAEVFTKIEWPWFNQPWREKTQRFMGEDSFFCWRCHEASASIYIDHDLSWSVEHLGTYGYSMKDVLTERELSEAGAWEAAE